MPRARIASACRAERAAERVDPRGEELLVRLAGRAANRAIDAPGNELLAVVVDHRPDRLLAVRLGDPFHEKRPVEVPDVALRPPPRDVREHVERCDVVLEDVGPHPHVPHGRSQAPAARTLALFEHGQPLEQPVRLHLVGREGLAEHAIHQRGDAPDVIDVENVRVLVREQFEIPVVDVAERGHVVRRGDVEAYGVVRQPGRRTVGAVGLIGEEHLRLLAGNPADRGRQAREYRLAQRRQVLGDFVLGRVVRDSKVRRLDGLPQELRIVGSVRRPHRGQHHERERDEREEEAEAPSQAGAV